MERHVTIVGSGNYGAFIQSVLADEDVKTSTLSGRTALKEFPGSPASHAIIATPNHTHASLVEAALKSGKHVLCEKPLAIAIADVENLYHQAATHKHYLGVGFVLPSHPFYQAVKSLQHHYGPIHSIQVMNNATEAKLEPEWYWNQEQSGGWFLVSEIHWYHLFAWLTNTKEAKVKEASETKENGRTRATQSVVANAHGQTLLVTHRLDAEFDSAWCKVEIEYAQGKVTIDDWVPRSLSGLDTSSGIVWSESYRQEGETVYEVRSRADIYKDMVKANVTRLLTEDQEAPNFIVLAHKLAIEAQHLSDQAS